MISTRGLLVKILKLLLPTCHLVCIYNNKKKDFREGGVFSKSLFTIIEDSGVAGTNYEAGPRGVPDIRTHCNKA